MPASRRRTGGGAASSRRTAATGVPARRGSRSNAAATSTTIAPLRVRATGLLLRFISCGLISLTLGLVWRLTLAPKRIGVGSALLGMVILLSGFVVGGVLWYLRDARLRLRNPARVPDERIVFSFVVFVLVPAMVLVVVGAVWILALIIGAT